MIKHNKIRVDMGAATLCHAVFLAVFLLALCSTSVFAAAPVWPEATRNAKPWVYNWCMGSAVDERGLEFQSRELSEKGFGGFHIIPIYGARGYESKWKKYLS